ncbi:SAGA-associated factor 11 homolog [Aricia agestis]|uniref:SAGA-associated factor 11 homolog n=1 Tax=Aricia agestis TaxID=91739 RepID=UPI001C20B679|nr:SAGA-associated factor 11 homolog [Aricia agestis]
MSTIVSELSMNDLNSKFFEIMQNENNAENAANFIFDSVCDDVTLGFIFEFHHGLKTGLTDLIEGEKEDDEGFKIVNSPECDVFGFSILKKTPDSNCSCPNCERPVSATRFAPHLEKCMGMGRNSSRIASRRIASNSREPTSYAGLLSDDDDDADWAGGSIQSDRRKRRMKNNNSKKSSKVHKNNNGHHNSDSSENVATYETMSANEKKNLLLSICGVVSEHTKKLCTRSMRCPQHTDEQRRALRNSVLEPSTPESQTMGMTPDEAGSPPDSSPSSSCSSSSRKRDRHKAAPKKRRDRNMSPNGRD